MTFVVAAIWGARPGAAPRVPEAVPATAPASPVAPGPLRDPARVRACACRPEGAVDA